MVSTGVVVAGLGTGGCVDAKGRFDDYDNRVGTTDASTIDGPEGMIADINGTFLFATDPAFIPGDDPAYEVQFIATWTLTRTANGATLSGTFMPLRTIMSMPDRHDVPPAITASTADVALDGTFTQNVNGTLPGDANPVSGTSQPLMGMAMGTIVSADLVCGNLGGSVAGIDLTGSTFAAIRVTNLAPAQLPAPVAHCPGSQPTDAAALR